MSKGTVQKILWEHIDTLVRNNGIPIGGISLEGTTSLKYQQVQKIQYNDKEEMVIGVLHDNKHIWSYVITYNFYRYGLPLHKITTRVCTYLLDPSNFKNLEIENFFI